MILTFKKIFLLTSCFGVALVRGKSNKKIIKPKKVLIFQMAKLGDMVCTTPMFRAVKEKYPDCEVVVVGNSINKKILEGNHDVGTYIIFEGVFGTLRKIQKERVDSACMTAPDFIGLAILYLAGIPTLVAPKIENGYSPYETWLYKILRYFVIQKPHKMGSYAPREYLRLLEPIGIFTENTKKYLFFSQESGMKVAKFLMKKNIHQGKDILVGISPSAGNKIKKWPAERFAKVAKALIKEHHVKIIIIGGPRDTEEVTELLTFLPESESVINTCTKFSVDELKALIAKLNLFVAVDTGPIYIAEAFNVPTVDIVGPIDENEQPPIGDRHLVVIPLYSRVIQMHVMNARVYDEEEIKRQILSITAERVYTACEQILAKS